MRELMREGFISFFVWREKGTDAILRSVELALRVLRERRLTEAQKRYCLKLAKELIEILLPEG